MGSNQNSQDYGKQGYKTAVFFGVSLLALIGVFQFNIYRASQLELSDESDLASLKNSKVTRATELGKPQPVDQKNQKEVNLIMTDPAMKQKWDLSQTSTYEAWAKLGALGDREIKVCVIDTGVDIKHIDLKNNLWTNKGETGKDSDGKDKSKNGIDDDNNGYVDDLHGFNFVHNNGDLTDNHGHGTHIAGAIGAEGGNGTGISGVAPKVSLIIAKYYDPKASSNNNLVNTVLSIRYCISVGAQIINYSGGGLDPSEKEKEAIALAREKGILFVAAAGNEQSNSDVQKYYPADYDLDNIISVTAVDQKQEVLPTSNYGIQSVDIAAPGKNIYSTLPGSRYGYMTGTSQATAVVTGVAALIYSKYKDFDAARVIRHITQTGDLEQDKLNGKTRYQKRLNTYRALAILDSGVGATGAITQNTASMKDTDFSVSSRDISNDSGSSKTISPESLVGFGKDLQKMILDEHAAKPK
jgi:thermitase